MKKTLRFVIILQFLSLPVFAQQVLMQGWYWDYPKTNAGFSWADTLRLKAAALKQDGISHVWFPPHALCRNQGSNGYDPWDLFIGNQTTGLGTRPALNAMMSEFAAQGIDPVGDIVLNHRNGGDAEINPAVKAYITTHYNAAKQPFPSDRFNCVLPLGGSSGNGAGDYYFKISSKTGDARFNGYQYWVYMVTGVRQFSGQPAQNEAEPNGGGDCAQPNNTVSFGRFMYANLENSGGCGTDEFKLTIANGDFDPAGDSVFIYLNNTSGGYSDHRIYGIWSSARSADIVNDLLYQTYTNFTNMPSGRGQMNFEFFKPNTANASTTYLDGDWDSMLFFYDYDQFQQRTKDSLINYAKWNRAELGVKGMRIDAVKHFSPAFVGDMLDSMHTYGMDPSMVVGEWFSTNTAELSTWINNVKANMEPATQAAVQPKVFDFSLRENLRQACDNSGFDVRNIFNGSLHDADGVPGFNIVTFVNNHDFRDASGFNSLVRNHPNLAYAYTITNNQLGVPGIFYPDYFGYPAPSGPLYGYHPTGMPAYRTEISNLITALKIYINGSPSVDYLNRFATPYGANYLPGSVGADKVLIYQLQGHAGNGNKDVIVAINFGATDLKVDHNINTRGGAIAAGTRFTDILGRSNFPFGVLSAAGQLYFELPAYSYSVWVQGTVPALPLNITSFSAAAINKEVKLTWIVPDNGQISRFEVQRSSSGNSFESILFVPATTKHGQENYLTTDAAPQFNRSILYRLKIFHKDGSYHFSDARMVRINLEALTITIKENPVHDRLKLDINSAADKMADLSIYNVKGEKLMQHKLTITAGNTIKMINLPALPAGTYAVSISDINGFKQILKFTKAD
ncbi:MAG: alpha-amylase family glycosyl hydrolase [Ferruginibacter sp.]